MRVSSLELTTAENEQREYLCPQCSKPMINMGHDFKTPPKNDQKQWQKVKILYQHGFTYHSCGCGGPGYRPKNLNQVQHFLEANKQLSAGEKLLQKIGTKKSNPS